MIAIECNASVHRESRCMDKELRVQMLCQARTWVLFQIGNEGNPMWNMCV